jgi:hypothetical protein
MDARRDSRTYDPTVSGPGQRPGDDTRMPRGAPAPNIVPPAAPNPVMGEEVLHARPGPGAVNIGEEEFRERMDMDSPDGRPPPQRDRRSAKWIFGVGLAVAFFAVLTAIWYYAGPIPGAIAILLMVLFIGLAAWPAWHAALDRRMDATRVKREVAAEHTQSDKEP